MILYRSRRKMRLYSFALPAVAITMVMALFATQVDTELASNQDTTISVSIVIPEPTNTPAPIVEKLQVVSNYQEIEKNSVVEPTQPPISTVDQVTNYDALFEKYSNEFGVDTNWLKTIAKCESNFNKDAVNGSYAGLFQFAPSSWQSARTLMGLDSDPSLRFNPEEAIRTTAFLLSQGRASMWPVCSRI